MRNLFRLALILLSFTVMAAPVAAHAAGPDVYFGYSRLGANAFHANTPGLDGWQAEASMGFIPFIGIDGDVAHYGLGAASTVPHSTTFMIGPRVTVGARGVHVYGHGLFGGQHSSNSGGIISSNSFTVAAGGGVDYHLISVLAARFNIDYIDAPGQSPSTASHYRWGIGLAARF